MNTLRIFIAENNRYGDRSGVVHRITIENASGEMILDLEPRFVGGVKCISNDRIIEMYGVRVKLDCIGTMVGNVFWNLYEDYNVGNYAIGFIQLLQRSKEWACTSGLSAAFEKFNEGGDITGKDLGLNDDVKGIVVNPNQYEINFVA